MPLEILVVDDEPLIRQMLELALPPHGLAVRTAAGGRQALDLYRTHRDTIDLVLLDVNMPGLDGPQTLARLREIDPDVRCCFMTGHSSRYGAGQLLAMGADHVFGKPFGPFGELASLLREAATRRAG
jgi:two-component system, OmpR family, response regulator